MVRSARLARAAPLRRRLSTLALAAALAAPGAAAQGSAGTGSGIVLANEMVSCGGLSLTLSGAMAAATVGQVAVGPEATSANYILRSGVAWMVPEVVSTGPIVFGVREMSADKDGGQAVEIRGFNFLQPGAGPLNVTFGGQPGTGTVVTSETIAVTHVPGGVTALGNPPPVAAVAVNNALGAHAAFTSPLRPSFVYEPALIRTDHARLGRTLHLHLLTDPGVSIILALGKTIPGVGIAVSPLEGSAETLINVQLAVPFAPVTGEQYTHAVHVPDDPTLVGQSVTFQGVALTGLAPLAGAFSNPLTLLIQP